MVQQTVQHQMMGYDRASIVFSPDGRLLQTEYAKKAVRQGPPALGITCKEGVLLIADKRVVEKLIIPKSIEKVYEVDEHIAATATGFLMDARVLLERAQLIAQQHKLTFDEPIDILTLVKEISNIKQAYTQYGGARPFGISLLFGAVNDEPQLFVTDPAGIFLEYKATAIGEGETEIKEILEAKYKENMTMDEALKLAISALKKVLGKEFDINRIDGAFITMKDKKFERLNKGQIKKLS